ncbi:MAG: hypothetical protein ABSB19_01725 [Methylomonas sp.]|jgi:hypothetical protein
MSEMYDVFVSGVNPGRIGELESIRENVRATLGIAGDSLEMLLNANGQLICIQENIPENKASKICQVLTELGLLSSYERTNAKRWSNLSLGSPESPASKTFTCSVCQQEHPAADERETGICLNCSKEKDHARQIQDEIAEIEALRKSMLLEARLQEQREEAEKRRMQQTKDHALTEEQIVMDEDQQAKQPTASFNPPSFLNKYIIPAILLAICFAGISAYFLWPVQNPSNSPPVKKFARETDIAGQIAADNSGNTVKNPVADDKFSDRFPKYMDIMNAVPMPAAGQFGSTPELISAVHNIKNFLIDLNAPRTPAISEKRLFVTTLYQEQDSDVEWNRFLVEQAKEFIKNDRFKDAFRLSQLQTDLTDHIDVSAAILTEFFKLGRKDLFDAMLSKLNQRIKTQTPEMQIIDTAQLESALQPIGVGQNWAAEAEREAFNLSDPVKTGLVFSKIAVFEKSAGETESLNRHLAIAQDKLNAVTPSFEQFSGLINLALDYTKIGNNLNAEVSLILAELSLIKLDAASQATGLSMLLKSAYKINNGAYIKKYADLIHNPASISKASYQSIETQYHDNTDMDVSKPLARITEPGFLSLAMAYAGLLEMDPVMQNIWFDGAEQQLALMADHEARVLACSKIARYMYRQKHINPALNLFDQAGAMAKTIANPQMRDAALVMLASDKARVLLTESAKQTVDLIQDEGLKAAFYKMLNYQEEQLAGISF